MDYFSYDCYALFDTKEEVREAAAKEGQKHYWVVELIESEAGWGSKLFSTYYFLTKDEAERFTREYNWHYNADTVTPAWYIAAQQPVRVKG